jgi:hypothetical protein
LTRLLASTAMVALAVGLSAVPARADGDPASDVLATAHLFLPQDAGAPPQQAAQLGALLHEAERSGYAVRVALIASAGDLGSVTALWRQPQNYARFLGQELSLIYRGPLLVVMPDGVGLYRARFAGALATGRNLVEAADAAVLRLAAAAGHSLTLPAAGAAPTAGSTDAGAWVAFAVGGALIALAWAASVRARPLGRRAVS